MADSLGWIIDDVQGTLAGKLWTTHKLIMKRGEQKKSVSKLLISPSGKADSKFAMCGGFISGWRKSRWVNKILGFLDFETINLQRIPVEDDNEKPPSPPPKKKTCLAQAFNRRALVGIDGPEG